MLTVFGTILENFGDFVLIFTMNSCKSVIIAALFSPNFSQKKPKIHYRDQVFIFNQKGHFARSKFFLPKLIVSKTVKNM